MGRVVSFSLQRILLTVTVDWIINILLCIAHVVYFSILTFGLAEKMRGVDVPSFSSTEQQHDVQTT